jgi:glycosyltransferase involved in cell wall biosynthesis
LSAENPTVSVIVPVYDGERYVRDALMSVLAQEGFDDFEIIVIDDGSTDGSAAIVTSIDDPRIRFSRQENRGIGATRNVGIRKSRGRFIAFLDQDDLWHPTKLAVQIPLIEARPEAGLVHCMAARIDAEGRTLHPGPRIDLDRMNGDVREGMLVMNLVPGTAGVVVRRTCFDELGLFDEAFSGADDWEMWARIASRYEFRYTPEALCSLRLHGANTSLDVDRMKRDSLAVQAKLFDDPAMVRGFSKGTVRRLRRRSTARIHHFVATWLLRNGRTREARRELGTALRLHPTRLRHLVLYAFSAIGWIPGPIRRRLI